MGEDKYQKKKKKSLHHKLSYSNLKRIVIKKEKKNLITNYHIKIRQGWISKKEKKISDARKKISTITYLDIHANLNNLDGSYPQAAHTRICPFISEVKTNNQFKILILINLLSYPIVFRQEEFHIVSYYILKSILNSNFQENFPYPLQRFKENFLIVPFHSPNPIFPASHLFVFYFFVSTL